MQNIRRASWRSSAKPARNPRLAVDRPVPPIENEDASREEMDEIERLLELRENGECEMGCDYPDGPMSPSGCQR